MSDAEVGAGLTGNEAKEGSTAPASDDAQTISSKSNEHGGDGPEADSEAETLIESPEKKKNIVDSAPRLSASVGSIAKDSSDPQIPPSDGKTRKRKRTIEENNEDLASSPKSSRRSSPLSSPGPHRADDSDSDASRKSTGNTRNGASHNSDQDTPRRSQLRKRRPSDIVPAGGKGADSGRRETRSATYPRHSSERSVSPKREHRRVASTQINRKMRPSNINTRRNFSSGRRSSSPSSSPPPSRPQLQKYNSLDHDTMSPAKSGPRKWTDKNGRTFLARACNNDNLEAAKTQIKERPQDLNIADNAGNTPLQIAALEGYTGIVKLLLENKCDMNTRNIDKETPLIDAVENGHMEVVKLLLDHGANPRLGNAKGDEPYELVKSEDKNYNEIRKMIAKAINQDTKRRKSDDQAEAGHPEGSSHAADTASPRDSPPLLGPRSPPTLMNRRRTGRSESTRNDLLWQANTQENLTRLAGKGDAQGVASILNVLTKAEPESLIAAAKAGHEEVLQFLLGMGSPDPDPDPIRSADLKAGYNTPMLAAIGRGNPDVVQLLVEQAGFNPTREFQGRKYYEIAQQRKGVSSQAEHDILKAAYDRYVATSSRKHGSPKKTRELDKEKLRRKRESSSPAPIQTRGQMQSPAQSHKSLPSKDSAEKHRRHLTRDKVSTDRSIAVSSDREPSEQRKTHKTRRSQSDLPTLDPETVASTHRRRRLVTAKEHRRRQSVIDDDSSNESHIVPVKEETSEKPGLKRSRDSLTPDKSSPGEAKKLKVKKRLTVADSSSPEQVRSLPKKKTVLRKPSGKPEQSTQGGDSTALSDIDEAQTTTVSPTTTATTVQESKKIGSTIKEVDKENIQDTEARLRGGGETSVDVDMSSETVEKLPIGSTQLSDTAMEDIAASTVETAAEQVQAAEDTVIVDAPVEADVEDPVVVAERKAAEEAAQKAANEAAEEAAEEQRKADEQAAKKKAEEDAAIRRREEEERRERLRREAEERQRRLDQQKRRELEENERRRREALPSLLSKWALMLDLNDPKIKDHAWLKKFFLPLYTVKTRQLDPACAAELADEEWIANFQIAGLLATKDLQLRQYTSFEKRPVTDHERQCLWKVARNELAFDYFTTAFNTPIEHAMEREEVNKPKFEAMEDLFWVKLSGFQEQVFRYPHLIGLNLRRQPIGLKSNLSPSAYQNAIKPAASTPPLANGISPYMKNLPTANGAFMNGTVQGHGSF